MIYLRSLTKSAAPGLRVAGIGAHGPAGARLRSARLLDDFEDKAGHRLRVLRAALQHAVNEDELVSRNVARQVKMPARDERRTRAWWYQ